LATELGTGPGESDSESVEWSALIYASIEGLASQGTRLVATAVADLVDEAEPGHGRIAGLAWPAVRSVFADDHEAAPTVAALAPQLAGLAVDAACARPGVIEFASGSGLLWYDASEVVRGLVQAVTAEGPQPIPV
jgi:hypothetical protein